MIPAGLLLPLSKSFAADLLWDNPGTGLFTDGANWNTDTAPTAADNAFIANGGTAQVLTDEFVSVNTLRVQSGAVELTNAILTTGITSSTWQSPGDLQIGGIAAMTGSLTASGASEILTGRVRVGGWNEGGVDSENMNGSLTMSGDSTLQTAVGGGYDFWVGNGSGSTGTLNMSGWSAITVNSSVTSGRVSGSMGIITLDENSSFSAATQIQMGEGGTATWTVKGNSSLTSGSFINVGSAAGGVGGTGTLTIQDNATVQVTGNLAVGADNASTQGTLNLNGGTLTAPQVLEGSGSGTINFNGGTLRAGAASADFISGFEAGDVVIQAGGAGIDTNSFDVEITLALTGDGGLAKLGLGTLTLSGANTYMGDTAVVVGVLSITSGFLSDTANVSLGSATEFHLNFVGTDTVNGLIIDGVGMDIGTWGAVGSGADHESSLFTGTGLLQVTAVVPEPSTIALVFVGLGMAGWRLRRRR